MMVSVLMISYGHENYITRAIEGVLMQEVNFDFELIITDDNSPDNTHTVVQNLIKNNSNSGCIKYFRHSKNIGMHQNFFSALDRAKGKYIAICEGDDYWIDKKKLQMQVDFLEFNPEYSMTCHNANIIYEGIDKKPTLFNKNSVSSEITMKQVVNKWLIPTASMVFRREYVIELPIWFDKIYSGDFTKALLLSHFGKIWFFKDVMSVYRINYKGSSATSIYFDKKVFVLSQHLLLLDYFNKYTNYIYSTLLLKRTKEIEKEIKFLELREKSILIAICMMPLFFIKKVFTKLKSLICFL